MNTAGPHLDARPLLDAIEAAGVTFGVGHPLSRHVCRARSLGWVTTTTADRIAIQVLGVHPVELWPNEWINA